MAYLLQLTDEPTHRVRTIPPHGTRSRRQAGGAAEFIASVANTFPFSLFRTCSAAMAAPSAALSISGATHTNAFGCKPNKLNSNRNHLQPAISSSKNANRCGKLTICRAQSEDSKGGGGFLAGFLIGGAIFGALGYVFAPQISKTVDSLLDENGQDGEPDEQGFQRAPRPRYYDEGLEKTRQTLGDKIGQLNLAIDKAASRLRRVTGNVEKEAFNDETEIEISSLNEYEHVVENLNEHGFVQGEGAR